jgi:hypothetical protein
LNSSGLRRYVTLPAPILLKDVEKTEIFPPNFIKRAELTYHFLLITLNMLQLQHLCIPNLQILLDLLLDRLL